MTIKPKRISEEEITLNPKRYIVSKTNTKGIITYGNDYFVEISGYTEPELIGQPHNIIRHPDMPRVIFKVMWERIQSGQNIMALVKNLSKDGRYYWVITEFEAKKDRLTNKIIQYTAFRKAAPKKAVNAIIPLYQKLLEIEDVRGMEEAEGYLNGFLEDKGLGYDEYIDKLVGNTGIFKIFFATMKKMFG
ncbi:PAS domain-containing protein [Sulfurovum sp.]|uniref:PAS domain-containing protein n=1 Tax=Sulfurovum sp. TaxID=1969726 RepID=UPI00262BF3A2|nr:PAS domain-containing protein [Sulfurovum sp.]